MPEKLQEFPAAGKTVCSKVRCRVTVVSQDGAEHSQFRTVSLTPSYSPVAHNAVYERGASLTLANGCRLINSVRDTALSADNDLVGLADEFWIRASLLARHDDPHRASELTESYLVWRRRVQYHNSLRSLPDAVTDLITRGMFQVMGNRSRSGHPVLTIRFRMYHASEDGFANAALAFALVIEYMLREVPGALICGITLMEDFTDTVSHNIDLRFLRFIITGLSTMLPVQLRGLYFVKPGRIVKLALRMVLLRWSRKLRSTRISIFDNSNLNKLDQCFDETQLPSFIHSRGSFQWTQTQQESFVDDILFKCVKWPKASRFNEENYVWYSL